MKIIARQNQPETKQIICEKCGCTVEYDEHDLIDLEDGFGFNCPDCKEEVYVEHWQKHQFPQAFYGFGKHEGAVTLSNADTQNMVNEVAKYMEDIDIGQFTYIASGDTVVIGLKSQDEDTIIVAKNYWEEAYNFRD